MADHPQTFVIVGAGQAGAWVARTLRSDGFTGEVVLVGEEPHWPYERPPLSKAVLLGASDADEGVLLTEGQAASLAIAVQFGRFAKRIDRAERRVELDDGSALTYDALFLTTGSRPRLLPLAQGVNPEFVHYLRTRADAAKLKSALHSGRRLVILGGGWIGLEVAASARALGVDVTVIESAGRVCARSAPPVVSAYLQSLHAARGVAIRTGVQVASLEPRDLGLRVKLADSSVIDADHLLIGIGAIPNVELAEGCGLDVDNGILVDEAGRTSDPAIFAAGDVTNHFNGFCGCRVRLESFANAQAQGVVAARAALGLPAAYDEVPWLWSDQFNQNIQIVGAPDRACEILSKGVPESGKGVWLMLDALGAPVGAVAVNDARELRGVRKALQTRAPLDLSTWTRAAA